jgi:hypothetical protein
VCSDSCCFSVGCWTGIGVSVGWQLTLVVGCFTGVGGGNQGYLDGFLKGVPLVTHSVLTVKVL